MRIEKEWSAQNVLQIRMFPEVANPDEKTVLDFFESALAQENIEDFIFAKLNVVTKRGEESPEIIATLFIPPAVHLMNWKEGHVSLSSKTLELERVIGEYLLSKADIPNLPEALVNLETQKMLEELSYELNRRGHSINKLIRSSGKSINEIRQEISPQAGRRARLGLILRKIAKEESIDLLPSEVDEEIEKLKKGMEKTGLAPDFDTVLFREYVRNISLTRKVFQYVIKKITHEAV